MEILERKNKNEIHPVLWKIAMKGHILFLTKSAHFVARTKRNTPKAALGYDLIGKPNLRILKN